MATGTVIIPKNKHLSQSIHKRCNNRHANLYYTNNRNHDKFARDGKKLKQKKKRKIRHKLLTQTTNNNSTILTPKIAISNKKSIVLTDDTTYKYYSQLFYTEQDSWRNRYGDDKIIIKPEQCNHCIKIKTKLNISFTDSKPEHEIFWRYYHKKSDYLEDMNYYQHKQISQVSNIEKCDLEISSSFSYAHFPKNRIYKTFNVRTIPFERGLGCGGRVYPYDDIFIVLTKCIESIVRYYSSKSSDFDIESFKTKSKFIEWQFDPKDYHSKYWECKGNNIIQSLVDIKVHKDIAEIIAGYLEYDRIFKINVNGRLYCWCDQQRFIDAVEDEKLISFDTQDSAWFPRVMQSWWMGYFCDVDGMNKRIFDNFVVY